MWHCDLTAFINPCPKGTDAIIQLTYSSFHSPSGLSIKTSLKIIPRITITNIPAYFFTIVKIPI